MIDPQTFDPDVDSLGSKGLVYIGDKVLVYRRDHKTTKYPLYIDVPGGGPEPHETPFKTFQREVKEEFGLTIKKADISYSRRHRSTEQADKFAYFMVAKLDKGAEKDIVFGNEGLEYMLMAIDEYIARPDAWPVFQHRTKMYLESSGRQKTA